MPFPFQSHGDSAVSWNAFRLVGDALHLAGMVLGLTCVVGARSVEGFSRKTQVLYQLVYVTRYLDVLFHKQVMYLLLFKVAFNLLTAAMLVAFTLWQDTYCFEADSCNIVAIVLPAAVVAYAASHGDTAVKELWTYSEFIEPFALVPQYIMCYRVPRVRPAVVLYVFCVGGYRTLYICNWIYKRYNWHEHYHDYVSWLGGAVECVLFFDFVFRISQRREVIGAIGASALGRVLLQLDNSAGRLSEKVELQTIGRRLPFGLSGNGLEDDERAKRQWDVSDKLVAEESCSLLTLGGDNDDAPL
uniref:ER lumen protein-retaining receptor n=1 Tax=Zooxanthella nutricula TaxID=1333877 RepID=A0A7S2QMZ2_9DINO|mmetsp:Transcript_96992/g.296444  ORF Transcript_96992/g.296444 Transcript_96992/m.296444 type:complete len:301 (+) Transcript_96992:1-903(+)